MRNISSNINFVQSLAWCIQAANRISWSPTGSISSAQSEIFSVGSILTGAVRGSAVRLGGGFVSGISSGSTSSSSITGSSSSYHAPLPPPPPPPSSSAEPLLNPTRFLHVSTATNLMRINRVHSGFFIRNVNMGLVEISKILGMQTSQFWNLRDGVCPFGCDIQSNALLLCHVADTCCHSKLFKGWSKG